MERLLKMHNQLEPNAVETICNWGVALGMTGRLDEAVIKFEKALDIKPDYIDAWINCGMALAKMGMFEQALKKYEKALSLNPKRSNVKNRINEIKKLIKLGNKTPEKS